MGDVPDHVGEIALLPDRSIDLEGNAASRYMTDLGYGMDGSNRRRLRE